MTEHDSPLLVFDLIDDKATKIISTTEDDSTEIIVPATPRSKASADRIWTSGQKRTSKTALQRPRSSTVLIFEEPLAKLPLVPTSSTGSVSLLDSEWERECEGEEVQGIVPQGDGDSEGGKQPQSSLTLRELLLEAGASRFDLIADEEEEYVEELPGWEWDAAVAHVFSR